MRSADHYTFNALQELSSPLRDNIGRAIVSLSHFLTVFLDRPFEIVRLARILVALLEAGCSIKTPIFLDAINHIVQGQYKDGGWSDPEETAFALAAIGRIEGYHGPKVRAAERWLASNRKPGGGWGRHPRDQARITTTALISVLAPSAFITEDRTFLINNWKRDFLGSVRLSYKAGFFLLAMAHDHRKELVTETIAYLAQDQNPDGGFAPWQGHPICSDAWSTGVVLWGLSRWIGMVDKAVIQKAISWLERTQLPSGYWPYHYLDDGTSLALIGAVSVMKALASVE